MCQAMLCAAYLTISLCQIASIDGHNLPSLPAHVAVLWLCPVRATLGAGAGALQQLGSAGCERAAARGAAAAGEDEGGDDRWVVVSDGWYDAVLWLTVLPPRPSRVREVAAAAEGAGTCTPVTSLHPMLALCDRQAEGSGQQHPREVWDVAGQLQGRAGPRHRRLQHQVCAVAAVVSDRVSERAALAVCAGFGPVVTACPALCVLPPDSHGLDAKIVFIACEHFERLPRPKQRAPSQAVTFEKRVGTRGSRS